MNVTFSAAALALLAAHAGAQPRMEIRFDNGTNAITVDPGSRVHVGVYATGLPALGSMIPWHTHNVPYLVRYIGFAYAGFGMEATGGTWTNPLVAPGFIGPPFGNAGTPNGASVTGIDIGVGFGPPLPQSELLLWTAELAVEHEDVDITTALRPMTWYTPSQVGFEIIIDWGGGGLFPSDALPASDGIAHVLVPAPGTVGFAVLIPMLWHPRRRRPARTLGSCH